MSYEKTIEYLYSLQKFGIKFGLSSTENLLSGLGRPHLGLPCLHLAGTNGKGSTGATLAAILTRAGYRVGFFTSPHLVSFRERFVIGREMIGRREVVNLTNRVRSASDPGEPPTFFEFITAMAFVYFAEHGVDLAIMETGMGGRLDATNVASPLVGVITNIAIEHTDYLGRTLAEIAGEKAGIIKPGLDVVTGEKRPALRELFEKTARDQGGRLYLAGRDFRYRARRDGGLDYFGLNRTWAGLKLKLAGPHQSRNAALALASLELLEKHGFTVEDQEVREGLLQVAWPGRCEVFPGGPGQADLMLDGAHNPAAARVLAATLTGLTYRRLHLVLGIMADKDIAGIMAPLLPLADEVYLTRPDYSRAASPEVLAKATAGCRAAVFLHRNLSEAMAAARAAADPEDLVLITGSLFTVGEARGVLTGTKDD
jgi:dihydrofolate synthase/folylpolyglutamate synthase